MKLFITFLLLGNLGVFASHWQDCDLTIEVKEIKKYNRLGASTIVREDFNTNKIVTDERGVILSIKVLKITKQNSENHCQFDEDTTFELYVMPTVNKKLSVGKTIKLNYKNIGDSLGSQVTWDIISE